MTRKSFGSALPLLLASEVAGQQMEYPLDRVRMQKGVFLLLMGGPPAWSELYDFRPYNWGPYSGLLSDDLDRLQESGHLRVQPMSGSRYGCYVTTAQGEQEALRYWNRLSHAERDFVARVRTYVTSRSFNTLLDEVYEHYPEYATETLYRPWRSH